MPAMRACSNDVLSVTFRPLRTVKPRRSSSVASEMARTFSPLRRANWRFGPCGVIGRPSGGNVYNHPIRTAAGGVNRAWGAWCPVSVSPTEPRIRPNGKRSPALTPCNDRSDHGSYGRQAEGMTTLKMSWPFITVPSDGGGRVPQANSRTDRSCCQGRVVVGISRPRLYAVNPRLLMNIPSTAGVSAGRRTRRIGTGASVV